MSYDTIALGIQWDRLISIADEIINSLVRTSFSTNVRESYDLSCVVFDARARAIAQGAYSVPSFTGTAPATLAAMLERFPPESLRPGDVIATNDPWIGTGHLFDINVMQPVFRSGHIVGYAMSITHLPDIGGAGFSAAAREVYEEGFRIPVTKLCREGRPDELLLELVRANVRVAEQTIGDLLANVSCTTVGGRMLNEFMDEYGLETIEPLADAILEQSERAIRDEIARLPRGTYRNRIDLEGQEGPLTLSCEIKLADGEVHADFTGSSASIPWAINVPLCYTRAMTCYAVKVLTTPRIPNNEGSVRPIHVSAPAGCIGRSSRASRRCSGTRRSSPRCATATTRCAAIATWCRCAPSTRRTWRRSSGCWPGARPPSGCSTSLVTRCRRSWPDGVAAARQPRGL